MSVNTGPLTIEINGPTNSGKTALAVIIEKALIDAGFQDVQVNCMDGDAHPKSLLLKQGKFDIPERTLERTVVILDNNGAPEHPIGHA